MFQKKLLRKGNWRDHVKSLSDQSDSIINASTMNMISVVNGTEGTDWKYYHVGLGLHGFMLNVSSTSYKSVKWEPSRPPKVCTANTLPDHN